MQIVKNNIVVNFKKFTVYHIATAGLRLCKIITSNDRGSFEAGYNSGAQIITTDFYQKAHISNLIIRSASKKVPNFRVNPLFLKKP